MFYNIGFFIFVGVVSLHLSTQHPALVTVGFAEMNTV